MALEVGVICVQAREGFRGGLEVGLAFLVEVTAGVTVGRWRCLTPSENCKEAHMTGVEDRG